VNLQARTYFSLFAGIPACGVALSLRRTRRWQGGFLPRYVRCEVNRKDPQIGRVNETFPSPAESNRQGVRRGVAGSGASMFKYVLSLTFAAGLASAATISTSATCDGVTTTGTFSASCNDADFTGFASASAMVQTGVTIGISVRTGVQSLMNPRSASASANISGDYVFTVFGGTGGGFFYPCFVGSFASHSGALGEGSFGGVGFQFTGSSSFPASNCRVFGSLSDFFPLSKPFTFGVPQIVPLSMGVLVSSPGPLVKTPQANPFLAGTSVFRRFSSSTHLGTPSPTSPSRWWRCPSLQRGPFWASGCCSL
jgi:hypothetical protein